MFRDEYVARIVAMLCAPLQGQCNDACYTGKPLEASRQGMLRHQLMYALKDKNHFSIVVRMAGDPRVYKTIVADSSLQSTRMSMK